MVLRLTLRTEHTIASEGRSLVIHPKTGWAHPATPDRAKFVYAGTSAGITFHYKGEKYVEAIFPEDERVEYYEAMKVALAKSGSTVIIEPCHNLPSSNSSSWYCDIDEETRNDVVRLLQEVGMSSSSQHIWMIPNNFPGVRLLYYTGVTCLGPEHIAYIAGKLPLRDVRKCFEPVVDGQLAIERHWMEGSVCLTGENPSSEVRTVRFFLEGAHDTVPYQDRVITNWKPNGAPAILSLLGAVTLWQERGFGSVVFDPPSAECHVLEVVAYSHRELDVILGNRRGVSYGTRK